MTASSRMNKQYPTIVASAFVSLASGASLLVWSSPLAPLVFLGSVALAVASCLSLARPELPLVLAVLILFFPRGAVNDEFHYLSFDAAVAISFLGFICAVVTGTRRISWSAATLFMMAFLGWSFVTLIWAPNLVAARHELVEYSLCLTLLFLLHNLVDSPVKLNLLLKTLAVGGWILTAAGLGVALIIGLSAEGRLKIFEVNENLVPALLILALPGALLPSACATKARPLAIALSGLYLFTTLVLVALSGSRGGLLSLLVVLLVLMVSRQTRLWSYFGFALIFGALVLAPSLLSVTEHRFLYPSSGEPGGAFGGREIFWQVGWTFLFEYPLGAGIGNGKAIAADYLYSVVRMDTYALWGGFSTHNPVLDVGIDAGYPGMLLYLAVFITALASFVTSCSARTPPSLPASYCAVVSAMAAGFFVSWIRDGGMNNQPSFFVVLALLLAPARFGKSTKNRADEC